MSKRLDVKGIQKSELEHYKTYKKLAENTKNKKNAKILGKIAKDELKHYKLLKSSTSEDIKASNTKVWFYYYISKIFGLSFGLKLMERDELKQKKVFDKLSKQDKRFKSLIKDEKNHEILIDSKLREEKLNYASAIVLGLNDALVELTGTLTGLTFAIRNGTIIAITGLIMGIAAALSMAASGYQSSKEDNDKSKKPIKSALYTGIAYIITVIMLISPYFLISNVIIALVTMILIAILIICIYTYYISVAKGQKFTSRFVEMILISGSVAIISFIIGFVINNVFGISI